MRDRLAAAVDADTDRVWGDLADLVAIPSVADPDQYPLEECHRAARWVRDAFAELGFDDARLVETSDGTHAVLGERPGPPGAPTVLLYAHYDVQPPLDETAWTSPPFTLTERDGRWYGRGASDCKGNILAHLTALRALRTLDGDLPVHLKLVVEGSEEQGTGGLEDYLRRHPEELRADVILVCDAGNAAVGEPAATVSLRGVTDLVVRVETLASELHSGAFGGAAPDALVALVHVLSTLWDDQGQTTIDGLDDGGTWSGRPYDTERFRRDAQVLDGVELLGRGTVGDQIWARPALTVLGIDSPPVDGAAAVVQPRAAARLSLRVPPGIDPLRAQNALAGHLERAAPWGARLSVERGPVAMPFLAATDGPAFTAMAGAMRDAYDRDMSLLGLGGSIPLCNVFAELYPDAEIILMGVEEPQCLIHAPDESVAPEEIARVALTEALFLHRGAGRLTTAP
ncbi:dipeptidase [Streptomyces sp. NPDC007863]|uniref:dipeptidase n=1 Tax=Streptomyces sp. NPDC007863 TaxID=3154894 RepID=UPI0033D63A67